MLSSVRMLSVSTYVAKLLTVKCHVYHEKYISSNVELEP